MASARWRSSCLAAACLAVLAVAACTGGTSTGSTSVRGLNTGSAGSPSSTAPGASSSASPRSVPAGVNAAFGTRAREAVVAWGRAPLAKAWRTGLVLFPDDILSLPPSGGFPSTADSLAFKAGALVFTGRPSSYPDPRVTWAGGGTMKVRALDTTTAFTKLLSSGSCPACGQPLAVTAARPTTLTVATNKGQAAIPAWAFTLTGVSTPVIQAALAPGSYVTVPSGSLLSQPLAADLMGVSGAQALSGGRTLTVAVSHSPCDTGWGALVYGTASAVVVGAWNYNPNPNAPCPASLLVGPVTVRLSAPLAGRVILDAASGDPVGPGLIVR
jgi:hypothetical protein